MSTQPIYRPQDERRRGVLDNFLPPSTGPYNPSGSPGSGGRAILDNMMRGQGASVDVNIGPKTGSAIDRYYERLGELMPTRRQAGLGDLSQLFAR